MNGMVRKCKRFLVLALTALLVCNEIVVVEASGSGQAAVVEEVQQENATEATSLTSQEEDLDETGEGEVKEEVTTEVQEDGAEEVTQSEEVKSEEAESETKTEAATEDETELCAWDFTGKNIGVGCPSLLQGIFPVQGSIPYLLHWQAASLPLSYRGSPDCFAAII